MYPINNKRVPGHVPRNMLHHHVSFWFPKTLPEQYFVPAQYMSKAHTGHVLGNVSQAISKCASFDQYTAETH